MARDARRSRTNRIQPLAETTAAATINRPRAKSSVPCRSMGTERVPETPWWACRRSTLRFAVAEATSGSGERVLELLVELSDRVRHDQRPALGERPRALLGRPLIPGDLCLELVDLSDEIVPLRAGRIDDYLEFFD